VGARADGFALPSYTTSGDTTQVNGTDRSFKLIVPSWEHTWKEQCMTERRRFKQTDALEVRLAEEAKRLREHAKTLKPGLKRDIRSSGRRSQLAVRGEAVGLRSPGLQPPK
jgi:hypothetical protein